MRRCRRTLTKGQTTRKTCETNWANQRDWPARSGACIREWQSHANRPLRSVAPHRNGYSPGSHAAVSLPGFRPLALRPILSEWVALFRLGRECRNLRRCASPTSKQVAYFFRSAEGKQRVGVRRPTAQVASLRHVYAYRTSGGVAQRRASSTRLNGVCVARRNRLNPALPNTSASRRSPACAPRARPTSSDSECAQHRVVDAE